MKLSLETYLDAPASRVWREVKTVRLFRFVTAPVVVFRSAEPGGFPDQFVPGPHRVNMYLFGVLPMGQQILDASMGPDDGPTYWLRDNGRSALIKKWDHRVTVSPSNDGHTNYRDEVEIEAGILTPIIFAFAALFFRWRQHRWRVLVKRGFRYE